MSTEQHYDPTLKLQHLERENAALRAERDNWNEKADFRLKCYEAAKADYVRTFERVEQLNEQAQDAQAELAALRADKARLLEGLKADVSKVLQSALDGSDESLRYDSRFIRWGLVEERIHARIDAALAGKEAKP